MQRVKMKIPEKLIKGIPLTIRPGHTIRLKATTEPLTVHTGLSLFYAMAETLKVPKSLDNHVRVKQKKLGILSLNTFWLLLPMRLWEEIFWMTWRHLERMMR